MPHEAKRFKGLEWAAGLNDPEALNELGVIYKLGIGVQQNYTQAIDYFMKAISYGSMRACCHLADLLRNGAPGVTTNIPEAIRILTMAADMGYSIAQFMLGGIYLGKEEKERSYKNISKAIYYFALALSQNTSYAYNFAVFMANEDNFRHNVVKAFEHLKFTADQGLDNPLEAIKIQNLVGDFFVSGKGGIQDPEEAIRYYTLASDQGCKDAPCKMGMLYLKADINLAYRCFILAITRSSTEALNNLGVLFVRKGDQASIKWAEHYFTLAANVREAKNNLALLNKPKKNISKADLDLLQLAKPTQIDIASLRPLQFSLTTTGRFFSNSPIYSTPVGIQNPSLSNQPVSDARSSTRKRKQLG